MITSRYKSKLNSPNIIQRAIILYTFMQSGVKIVVRSKDGKLITIKKLLETRRFVANFLIDLVLTNVPQQRLRSVVKLNKKPTAVTISFVFGIKHY